MSISNTTMVSRMKHRVTLQQPNRVSDGGGGFDVSWATVGTYWAHIRYLPVSGELQHYQLSDGQRVKVYMRAEVVVETGMRLQFRGENWLVKSWYPLGFIPDVIEIIAERKT